MARQLPAGSVPLPAEAKGRTAGGYTLDDLPAVVAEVESVAETSAKMNQIVEAFHGRLEALEKLSAQLDITERQLPSEVIAGLSPAQVFSTALNAALQGMIVCHPTFNSLPENHQTQHVNKAIHVAEMALHCVLQRIPAKKQKA